MRSPLRISSDGIIPVVEVIYSAPDEDQHLYLHILFIFSALTLLMPRLVGPAVFSLTLSSPPPPSLSLRLINNTALATLAFLWFLWSWRALAWSRLPLAPWAWRRVQPRPPRSPTIVFVDALLYTSSASSEGCTDSGGARQCSPARFRLSEQCFLSVRLFGSISSHHRIQGLDKITGTY